MPRDAKIKKSREASTPALRKVLEFTDHLYQKLCNEKVFPKRSRWLFAGKIADLASDFEDEAFIANEIKVVTKKERDERHYHLTMAVAKLMALDAKITQAARVLDIPPNTLELYAQYANECRSLLLAWMNADEKRYGPPTGLNELPEKDQEFITAMMVDFEQLFRAWAASAITHYAGAEPKA